MEQAVAQVHIDEHGCLVIDDPQIAEQLGAEWDGPSQADKPREGSRRGIHVRFRAWTKDPEHGPNHPTPGSMAIPKGPEYVNSLCAC